MLFVDFDKIKGLDISPATCVEWIKESFSIKKDSQLPPKCSIHPEGIDFYTSMPCLLPKEYDRFCLKLVHRINGATPALGSDILVYEASTGELLALMDCDWITAMRTGAVATLAAQTLRRSGEVTYSFIGLGNTARATLACLLDSEKETMHNVILEEYKGYSKDFIKRFENFDNVRFTVMDSAKDVIKESDVIYSCVTQADELICDDLDCLDVWSFRCTQEVSRIATRCSTRCSRTTRRTSEDSSTLTDSGGLLNFRMSSAERRREETMTQSVFSATMSA